MVFGARESVVTAERAALRPFVARAFLWLLPCFAAWYFTAPFHSAVAGALSRLWVALFAPGAIAGLERQGSELVFVTAIEVQSAAGTSAALVAEVNPLIYTYGMALFVALMLASRCRWRALVTGLVILLPFQAWGIALDFLTQVGIGSGPEVAAQAGLANWRREVIALGYQVGALLFPSLVPVTLWAVFNRPFVEDALQTRRSVSSA
jgi:hypothetical protein